MMKRYIKNKETMEILSIVYGTMSLLTVIAMAIMFFIGYTDGLIICATAFIVTGHETRYWDSNIRRG